MKDFGFPKSKRLRSRADFDRVYRLRQSVSDRYLLIFGARNSLGESRCGLSVSRKHGNAVKRARLKRLLREAFRLSASGLPKGFDLVLIPRQDSGAGVREFQSSLKRLAEKLARRLSREDDV